MGGERTEPGGRAPGRVCGGDNAAQALATAMAYLWIEIHL